MTLPGGSLASLYIGNITCIITRWSEKATVIRIGYEPSQRRPDGFQPPQTHIRQFWTYPHTPAAHNLTQAPHRYVPQQTHVIIVLATDSPLHPTLHPSGPYVIVNSFNKLCANSGWCSAPKKIIFSFHLKTITHPWQSKKTIQPATSRHVSYIECIASSVPLNLPAQIFVLNADGIAVMKSCNHDLNKLHNYSLTHWFQGNTVLNASPRGRSRRTTFVFVSIMWKYFSADKERKKQENKGDEERRIKNKSNNMNNDKKKGERTK